MTTRRTVYLYPDDLERLNVLKSWYGLGTSAATRAGLALLLAHLQDEDEEAKRHALDTTAGPVRREKKVNWTLEYARDGDRTAQVNWLRELAGNIAANLGEGTAEELVDYALSDEGRESWGIEIPQWFDAHDRSLLIEWVTESL